MRLRMIALMLLAVAGLWACSEYDIVADDDTAGDDDTGPGDDDTAGDDDVADDDAADDDTDPGQDDDDDDDATDDDEEPPEHVEECPEDVDYSFVDGDGDGFVAVLSWDSGPDSATLLVDFSGVYHVYDTYIAESGASQINESGYVTITNSLNPTGVPEFTNCDDWYVVPDSDIHGTPPAGAIYIGTFPLAAGEDNILSLHHYCWLYRDGHCPQFHIGAGGADGSCDDNGANSIHMALDAICLVPM